MELKDEYQYSEEDDDSEQSSNKKKPQFMISQISCSNSNNVMQKLKPQPIVTEEDAEEDDGRIMAYLEKIETARYKESK